MTSGPVLIWFRRDLRLADHPALSAAVASGRPVIPVFVLDETVEALGAAAKWRLGLGLAELAASLGRCGARLVLRRGAAAAVIDQLVAETGAQAVYWTRYYEPAHIARDTAIKMALRGRGIEAQSFAGALLAEPARLQSSAGRPYAVFIPFWRALRGRDMGMALPAPIQLRPVPHWPPSEALADWQMGRAMRQGAEVVRPHLRIGEVAAAERLAEFVDLRLARYGIERDFPAVEVCSGLSENLAWGEISPRQIWQVVEHYREVPGAEAGAEKFLSELGWREFAWHLMAAYPAMASACWRQDWESFPWQGDNVNAQAWRRGMTGEPLVDAGMREMFVTGRMHNRVRMVVASYLTKHLTTDWRIGLGWFQDCLVDWDPAANALGWQWVAGCGPDAAPYFRVFNPATQAGRFDPDGAYQRRFLAKGAPHPAPAASAYFDAAPKAWGLSAGQAYPARRVDLVEGRNAALAAFAMFRNG